MSRFLKKLVLYTHLIKIVTTIFPLAYLLFYPYLHYLFEFDIEDVFDLLELDLLLHLENQQFLASVLELNYRIELYKLELVQNLELVVVVDTLDLFVLGKIHLPQ